MADSSYVSVVENNGVHVYEETQSKPRMSLREFRKTLGMERSLEDYGYVQAELIAEGGYGRVYKGWDHKHYRNVALKYMDHSVDTLTGLSQATLREVALLNAAKGHDNIVRLFDCCMTPRETILVLEYCEIDLSVFIKKHREFNDPVLNEALSKSIMRNVLAGTHHLHSRGISHRDLKPRNILLTSTHQAKIADFGLSKSTISFPVRSQVENFGTRWYRAPEVLLGCKLTTMRVDMWSIGTIFAELKERQAIFPGKDHMDQIHIVFATLGTPNHNTWPDMMASKTSAFRELTLPYYPDNRLPLKATHMTRTELKILEQFFQYQPCRRVSAEEALKFPYFAPVSSPAHLAEAKSMPGTPV